jgi:HSP20 family protein
MVYRTSLSAPVFGLRREIDRLFEDAFGNREGSRAGWSPTVDVREDQGELLFTVELPGIRPENVEVTFENGLMTIRGEKREERKEGDEVRYHIAERTYGSFVRSFQLPKTIDEDKIEARFEHGVLYVRVPKGALPQPKKIEVRTGASGGSLKDGKRKEERETADK